MSHNATLERWDPTIHAWNQEKEPQAIEANEHTAKGALLLALPSTIEQRDLVTLHRAARLNGINERLFHQNPKLIGTPWYDDLERVLDMQVEYKIDGRRLTLACPREPGGADGCKTQKNAHADAVVVHALVSNGHATRTLELPTDFAVCNDDEPDPDNAGVLLSTESAIDIEELRTLLCEAMFEPGDDRDDDCCQTQRFHFDQLAHQAACQLFVDDATAKVEIIRYAVRRHIAHLLPDDEIVRIHKHSELNDVEVEILPTNDIKPTRFNLRSRAHGSPPSCSRHAHKDAHP